MSTPLPQLQDFTVKVDGHVAILAYDLPRTGNSLKYSVFTVSRDTRCHLSACEY